MDEREIDPRVAQFIHKLDGLDEGDKARLRRNAGKAISEAGDVTGLFYRILPSGVPMQQEEIYFLVATLFPLNENGGAGNFGASLRRARTSSNDKGLDKRVEILLDAELSQLSFRLRQAVQFLRSNRVSTNWAKLLNDLLYWSHPDRFIQRNWARSYFSTYNKEQEN